MDTHQTDAAADEWAANAARLPLAFSQVREDPRIDLQLTRELPKGSSIIMIASGGDTAIQLARFGCQSGSVSRIHLVDMNAAQIALTRFKWLLATSTDADDAAAMLGHEPMNSELRRRRTLEIFDHLDVPEDIFGPVDFVAQAGPDHVGRYELTFAELRKEMDSQKHAINKLLTSSDTSAAARMLDSSSEPGWQLDNALARVMSQRNLVELFGAKATQNPRRPFWEHFAERIRLTASRIPPSSNPFLWQILAGRFPKGHRFDWLQDVEFEVTISPQRIEQIYHRGCMNDVLESLRPCSIDLIHLSNILDWLTHDEATATLKTASKILKPGGRIIIRQLNSTLDIVSLNDEIQWDLQAGTQFELQDRSFFYPGVYAGTRR